MIAQGGVGKMVGGMVGGGRGGRVGLWRVVNYSQASLGKEVCNGVKRREGAMAHNRTARNTRWRGRKEERGPISNSFWSAVARDLRKRHLALERIVDAGLL